MRMNVSILRLKILRGLAISRRLAIPRGRLLRKLALLGIVGVACTSGQMGRALADETPGDARVIVTLRSGRTFTGAVDEKTTQETLWLRFDAASTLLLRPIGWNRVVRAELAGKSLTGGELRDQYEQLVTKYVAQPTPSTEASALTSGETASSKTAEATVESARSIAVDARLANWDGDVAMDGLEVSLTALSASGQMVPVQGTVRVELIGDRRSLQKPQPVKNRQQFQRLGEWTRTVTPEMFAAGSAVIRLPFQAIDPEFDPEVRSRSLVRVRLTVPGSGVMEASVTDFWNRPFSVYRDWVEVSTGGRFLPQENAGR